MCISHKHILLCRVEPRHCGEGAWQTPVLPASSWAPGPTHPIPLARPLKKEARWPSYSQVPPHPATSELVPLSAGPCSAAPGPTRSHPSSPEPGSANPRPASLPERESPALLVLVSAREAFHARPYFTRLLWVWLLQKIWLLALQSNLPARGGDAGQRMGSGKQGKSVGDLWPTIGGPGLGPGRCLGSTSTMWACDMPNGSDGSVLPGAPYRGVPKGLNRADTEGLGGTGRSPASPSSVSVIL